MDKFDRFQLLHRQFRSHRHPIPIATLAARLECTEKTVKRAIESMRDCSRTAPEEGIG
ncbi:HTH domain-containing protein [Kineobactrum salinum]|uniref:HTH domain-containing protein n=1 Tax=Kineobactrum salinum TaxID=2708301 RepID=UPI001E624049|nr:HTH domain-containing protein [Kineobactrum salinum]